MGMNGSHPAATGIAGFLDLAPEVRDALASGLPAVALESTLVTHGLPYPANLDVARASEAAIRAAGAGPATVAIGDGRLRVGLTADELERLAKVQGARKASRPSLAAALAAGGWAGTTVSATMIAAHAAGIAVFATGGIGGVHRGAFGPSAASGKLDGAGVTLGTPDGAGATPVHAWPALATLDVSSDLEELARTPVAVVCAGPKAILDVPLTLEYLETRGVPVVAIGTDEIPGFYSRRSGIRAPESVADIHAAAALLRTHLALGLGSGALVCVPVPEADELPLGEARAAVRQAIDEAEAAGVHGPHLTPWLLARIAEITGGASVRANTALIVHDAAVAGRLAVALARG
jgi:pseudouridine-5'-phosphate glycosidase